MIKDIYQSLIFALLWIVVGFSCQQKDQKLFHRIPSDYSGIDFENTIMEYDTFNILNEEYIFNGGGVGVGDFDGDGLPDLFFTGNQVNNKLYLNLGGFRFKDVSFDAGIEAAEQWCTGVTVVDINLDGWPDIYISTAMVKDKSNRKNLLYVHQGLDENGIPKFKEEAEKYGIADPGNSMGAAFFDYDRDGDLDLYVMNNEQSNAVPGTYRDKITDGTSINNDRLYKNNGDGTFTDVSIEAGITIEGFGLGLAIADLNMDGWPDVYVGNDYLSNDLLYINNGDGTFSNQIANLIKHQSMFSMGVDVSDYNNDGMPDIVVLDMLAETNLRKKTTISKNQYEVYINNDRWGFEYQHVRNMLQLNNGPGVPFSEIGQLAGVYQTDWSWAPLFVDVDNNGLRDILITNGFPRDITDKDFMNYRKGVAAYASTTMLLDSIPIIKIPNYAYKNNGDLTFSNVGEEWGLNIPSFSNGAVFVDLDGDGDLDYVVNNINEPAFVFENKLDSYSPGSHFLRIRLKGSDQNPQGLGAKIIIRVDDGLMQFHEHYLTRGYMSSVEDVVHFGLGDNQKIQSLEILWPDGNYQKLENISSNQIMDMNYADAKKVDISSIHFPLGPKKHQPLLVEVSGQLGVELVHEEKDKVDYHIQRTLLHKLTQFGPSLAVGDINGDGIEDFIVGSAAGFTPLTYIQNRTGTFDEKPLWNSESESRFEEMGMVLFDIDNDGDLDLYLVSGSNEFRPGAEEFSDRLYLNDGAGNFSEAKGLMENINASGSVVRAGDFDGDGYMDLFVGGRTPVAQFPYPENSFLLKNNKGTLEDVTDRIAPGLRHVGMVTDAIWTDFDNDGRIDLMVVGELMAITLFKNTGSGFEKLEGTGLEKHLGWWNSIVAGDFDGDGDMDYIVGNKGANNYSKPTFERPVSVYAKDFDGNQSVDPVTFAYFKNSEGKYESVPIHFWDDLYGQSTLFRRKFSGYKYYARATEQNLFTEEELTDVLILTGNYDRTSYIENLGNGQFKIHELPTLAQFAPVNGMVVDDVNGDGHLDVLMVGNDYGNEVFSGRHDAMTGLVLLGDGKGGFTAVNPHDSGFLVPGDAKSMAILTGVDGNPLYLSTQNRGKLLIHQKAAQNETRSFVTLKGIHTVMIEFENGNTQRIEIFNRSGFYSNSGMSITIPKNAVSLKGVDYKGNVVDLEF
ncbi:VCBS repeat-containing protein [Aquiflexum sp.]|uniref:VCBS repeat-containing protein n=1 Tax=Aquiflexum sp. TaxID=1872584 RepID=UPI0035943755